MCFTHSVFRIVNPFVWVTLALVATSPAIAAPAKPQLAKVASLSARSLNRLAAEANALGTTLPSQLSVETLEAKYPWIGHGNLDADRPIGLVFYAGADVDPTAGQGIVAVFPIKRDKLSPKALMDAGAKPVQGVSGLFELNDLTLRRSANCLIFSTCRPAAVVTREQDLLELYKTTSTAGKSAGGEVVVRLSIDVAALKQAMPQKFAATLGLAKAAIAKHPLAVQFGQEHLLDSYGDHIHRLDMALASNDSSLSLKIGVAPVIFPPGGTFAPPTMPEGVILRLDVGAPPLKVMPWARAVLGLFPGGNVLARGPRSGQLQSSSAAAQEPDELTQILLGGQAVSIGVAPQGDAAVLFLVQQHVQSDPIARMKRYAEAVNLWTDRGSPNSATRIEMSQYVTSKGAKIARFKLLEGNASKANFDFFRRSDTAYVAISGDQGHFVETLLDLPMSGQFSGLASGSARLGGFIELIDPVAQALLPSSQIPNLHQMIKDQELTLTATGEADEVIYGLSLDKTLLKDLIALPWLGGRKK